MSPATAVGLKIKKDFKMPARTKVYVRKPYPVRAIKMDTDFEIETLNGIVPGQRGDYLIQNPAGIYNIMSPQAFETEYDALTIGGEKF